MRMKYGLGFWVVAAAATAAVGFEISDEVRLAIQRDVEAIEQDGPHMGEAMAALREIGASYLPELVAPVDVERPTTRKQRAMLLGACLMDLTYASTFDRHEDTVRFGMAAYELLDRLGHPQPAMARRFQEALRDIDLPGGDERLRALVQEHNQDETWQDMLRSGDGVEIVVDTLYGFLVEGLHLTTELCVLSGYDPAYMMYVDYMRESLAAYRRLLDRIGNEPELAAAIQQDEALNFLTAVLIIYADLPQLGPAQVDSLRPAIRNARQNLW